MNKWQTSGGESAQIRGVFEKQLRSLGDSIINSMAKYDKKERTITWSTQGKWNVWRNHDMILDSGRLGVETCVQIIQAALEFINFL